MAKYTCTICEIPFISYNKNAKYCSAKCKGIGYRKLKDINCPTCKKDFKPTASRQKYCSVGCRPQQQKNKIKKECLSCGKEIFVIPARLKDGRGKFCSVECFATRNKTVLCGHCNKGISLPLSDIREQNFCSQKCKNEWMSYTFNGENSPCWRGGHDGYRGENWKYQRRKALNRDENKCTECEATGKEAELHVHHKIPFRFFDNYKKANKLSNLQTLCNSCHSKQESHLWHEVPEQYQYLL